MVKKKAPQQKQQSLTIKERLRTPAMRMSWLASQSVLDEQKKTNEEFANAEIEVQDLIDRLNRREDRTYEKEHI
jgi:hypothetical protein